MSSPPSYTPIHPPPPNTKLKLQPHLPLPASTASKSAPLSRRITTMIPFNVQHRIYTSLLVVVLLYYIFTLRSLAISTPSIYSSAWPKPFASLDNTGSGSEIDVDHTMMGTIKLVDMQIWRLMKRAVIEGMVGVLVGREVVALQRVKGAMMRGQKRDELEGVGRRDLGWEGLGWVAVYGGLVVCGWGAVVR